jgi:hypothetical protein
MKTGFIKILRDFVRRFLPFEEIILPLFLGYNKLRQLTQMIAFSSFRDLAKMPSLRFLITQKATAFIKMITVSGNN